MCNAAAAKPLLPLLSVAMLKIKTWLPKVLMQNVGISKHFGVEHYFANILAL